MKTIEITIKFEPTWILSNQASGSAKVIEHVLEIIKERYESNSVFVVKKEFHQCVLIIATESDVKDEAIGEVIRQKVACVNDDTVIGIHSKEVSCDELKTILEPVKEGLQEENLRFLSEKLGIVLETQKANVASEDTEAPELDDLIAMEPIKKWVEEIEMVSQKFQDVVTASNFVRNFAYLFSINRGNGLTTALEVMKQTLQKNNLMKFTGRIPYLEWPLQYTPDVREFPAFAALVQTLHQCESGEPFQGIVAINIEEWIDHLNDSRLDDVLQYVWSQKDDILFIFTMPYADDETIRKVRIRIDDVISARTLKFVPPSDKQYFVYFEKLVGQYHMKLADDVYSVFIEKLIQEKNDGKFYGFNTVKKIMNEVIYKVIVNAAQKEEALPEVITGDAIADIYGIEKTAGIPGIEQLKAMVALQEVKDKVQEILSMVKLQKEMFQNGSAAVKPCYHMMFAGNPGTGKTVVARIIGRIFKEEGLLSVGNFFEASRKDLVGEFVGHTAPKTMELCRSAIGSVLFIDEAYTLAKKSDSYSSEAIGTLIAEMENHRDNMVVIFAGYEKELEELYDMNPGLRDRIPHKIHFPNYNRDELKQIFYLQLKNKMKFDSSFEAKVDEFFQNFPEDVMQSREFSNGRFVRNLAERILTKAALRFEMADIDFTDFCLISSDFEIAVADNDYRKMFEKTTTRNTIGY